MQEQLRDIEEEEREETEDSSFEDEVSDTGNVQLPFPADEDDYEPPTSSFPSDEKVNRMYVDPDKRWDR